LGETRVKRVRKKEGARLSRKEEERGSRPGKLEAETEGEKQGGLTDNRLKQVLSCSIVREKILPGGAAGRLPKRRGRYYFWVFNLLQKLNDHMKKRHQNSPADDILLTIEKRLNYTTRINHRWKFD